MKKEALITHQQFARRAYTDSRSLRRGRISRLLLAILIVTTLGFRPQLGTPPVSAAAYGWAYLLAHDPMNPAYGPDLRLQFNSTGERNGVYWVDVGIYSVTLPGFGEDGGTYQVTAHNAGFANCNLASWTTGASVQVAEVRCFDATGALVDSGFSLLYLSGPTPIGVGSFTSYLFANQPTTDAYSPEPTIQYNSLGHVNAIKRSSIGSYTATLPGYGQLGGIPQVTAIGPDPGGCKIASWAGIGTGQEVRVQCFDRSGVPVDRHFFLTFVQTPANGVAELAVARYSAYFFADNFLKTDPYEPIELNRFLSGPGQIQIDPVDTGTYLVHIPDVGVAGGHVQLTAIGKEPTSCVLVSWDGSVTVPVIRVHCYDVAGQLVNSAFTLSFVVG